jgi:purine-nucleoside/S-methyl-5'-thioadenosine phosphorylase / adenosine deaminase
MYRHESDGLALFTFESLAAYPELVHAITTRHGGVSSGPYASLNVSNYLGDDPEAVEENLRRVCAALGLDRRDLTSPNQRHTANVRRVGAAERGRIQVGYDALVTDQANVPLLLRYADCVPVLIYDPAHHAVALVHSGWRGTVLGASRAAVESLVREFGSRPEEMIAAIGPSIGPCCYEVGQEVVHAVQGAFSDADILLPSRPGGRRHLDLWTANVRWLSGCGVRTNRIEVSEMCTACHAEDFYSHRAENGKTGHFAAVMSLKE